MTHDPNEDLDRSLCAAVEKLIDATCGGQPPADLHDALLRRLGGAAQPAPRRDPPRRARMPTIVQLGLAAALLVISVGAISIAGIIISKGWNLLGGRTTVGVNTPRFELPREAIREYAALQTIRRQGAQRTVEYLNLGVMREYIESPFPNGVEPGGSDEWPENWKPDRSPDSARFEFLKEFENLKGLQLDYLYLTHRDLDAVAGCHKLERLSLNGIEILEETPRRLSGDDLQKLSGLVNLKELELTQSNFVGGLHHLSGLPNLRMLYLSSFDNLNDQSVAELKVLTHLESLVLAPVYFTNPQTTVTDAGLASLREIPNLKTLYVGYHGEWTMPVDKLRALLPNVRVVPPTGR